MASKQHKLFWGKLNTLIISGKIVVWLKSLVIGVKKSLRFILHSSKGSKNTFVVENVNIGGILHWKDFGKGERCLPKPVEICPKTTLTYQGVKIQNGMVVKEPTKMGTSWSGGQNTPIRTTTDMLENIASYSKKASKESLTPKKWYITLTEIKKTMKSQT